MIKDDRLIQLIKSGEPMDEDDFDAINPICKKCDHFEDKEIYTCLTCKGYSHFESLEEEIAELKRLDERR